MVMGKYVNERKKNVLKYWKQIEAICSQNIFFLLDLSLEKGKQSSNKQGKDKG